MQNVTYENDKGFIKQYRQIMNAAVMEAMRYESVDRIVMIGRRSHGTAFATYPECKRTNGLMVRKSLEEEGSLYQVLRNGPVTDTDIHELLMLSGVSRSRRMSKRLVDAKGIYLNGEPVTNLRRILEEDDVVTVGYADFVHRVSYDGKPYSEEIIRRREGALSGKPSIMDEDVRLIFEKWNSNSKENTSSSPNS